MILSVQIELTQEQIRAIAEDVAKIKTAKDPLSHQEAAKKLNKCVRTIRRQISAAIIPTVPGHPDLIPADYMQRRLLAESKK